MQTNSFAFGIQNIPGYNLIINVEEERVEVAAAIILLGQASQNDPVTETKCLLIDD